MKTKCDYFSTSWVWWKILASDMLKPGAGFLLNDKFAVIHVETFPVKSPSDGCFSQHAHGFVSMNWNLILWKGPKTPSQTTNRFWKSQDKHHGQSCFQWWSTFLVFTLLYFSLFFGPAINENSLKFEKKVFPILENTIFSFLKNVSQISFFPSKMSPKALKLIAVFSQAARQLLQVEHYEAVVEERSVLRPLWLSTLLSTSPWSARTKLGVATAALV